MRLPLSWPGTSLRESGTILWRFLQAQRYRFGMSETSVTIDKPVEFLDFPANVIQLGGRYELHVQGSNGGYYREFRVLSQQDREALAQTPHALRAEALESGEIAVLLRLANFYTSFDENEKVADVLLEVVTRPQFQELDADSQNRVKDVLNTTLRSLDRKNYEGL